MRRPPDRPGALCQPHGSSGRSSFPPTCSGFGGADSIEVLRAKLGIINAALGTLAREYTDAVDGSDADSAISDLLLHSLGLLRTRLIRLWEDTLGRSIGAVLGRHREWAEGAPRA
jgi:hypothetical protein